MTFTSLADIRLRAARHQAQLEGVPVHLLPYAPPVVHDGPYLYFMRNPDAALIKIGITDNVEQRRVSLSYACGSRLVVLATMKGAARYEKQLHTCFAADRTIGEWFRESARLIELAKWTALSDHPDQIRLWIRRGGRVLDQHKKTLARRLG